MSEFDYSILADEIELEAQNDICALPPPSAPLWRKPLTNDDYHDEARDIAMVCAEPVQEASDTTPKTTGQQDAVKPLSVWEVLAGLALVVVVVVGLMVLSVVYP
jgi:hypothetical protein